MRNGIAIQRCGKCRLTFKVLADEYGDHECPRCGYDGEELMPEEPFDEEPPIEEESE